MKKFISIIAMFFLVLGTSTAEVTTWTPSDESVQEYLEMLETSDDIDILKDELVALRISNEWYKDRLDDKNAEIDKLLKEKEEKEEDDEYAFITLLAVAFLCLCVFLLLQEKRKK